MSTGVVAAGAAAVALYVYLKQKQTNSDLSLQPALPIEACRDVEHAPNSWTEALYHVKEVFRYMYNETLGRWHTVDLFVGLAYLSNRDAAQYPAADIACKGVSVTANLDEAQRLALIEELQEVRRYMLYCKGLKLRREDAQLKFFKEHLGEESMSIIKQQSTAGVLRPAYVVVCDRVLRCVVLCVRGTHSMKDLFTSLAGSAKPHHQIGRSGVVLGYSHLGMLAAARWLAKQVTPLLRAALAAHPGYQLRIVGHSMGGGTAAMMTMMLRETVPEFGTARCYAVACPGCMTLELAASCRDYVTSLVNGTDIVPTFSAATVDSLREEVMHSSWFAEFQRDLRTSVVRTLQGGMRGVGTATQWTSRNIFQPAVVPFRTCYTLRRQKRKGSALEDGAGLPNLATSSMPSLRQSGDGNDDDDNRTSSGQALRMRGGGLLSGSAMLTPPPGMDGPTHLPGGASAMLSGDSSTAGGSCWPCRPAGHPRAGPGGGLPSPTMELPLGGEGIQEHVMQQTMQSCLYAVNTAVAGHRSQQQQGAGAGAGPSGDASERKGGPSGLRSSASAAVVQEALGLLECVPALAGPSPGPTPQGGGSAAAGREPSTSGTPGAPPTASLFDSAGPSAGDAVASSTSLGYGANLRRRLWPWGTEPAWGDAGGGGGGGGGGAVSGGNGGAAAGSAKRTTTSGMGSDAGGAAGSSSLEHQMALQGGGSSSSAPLLGSPGKGKDGQRRLAAGGGAAGGWAGAGAVAAQRAGDWLWRGMFNACYAPRRPPAPVAAVQQQASMPVDIGEYDDESEPGSCEDDDEEEVEAALLEAGAGPAGVLGGGSGSSGGLLLTGSQQQQLQAGITAVVAAVTNQATEAQEHAHDESRREAERVLREAALAGQAAGSPGTASPAAHPHPAEASLLLLGSTSASLLGSTSASLLLLGSTSARSTHGANSSPALVGLEHLPVSCGASSGDGAPGPRPGSRLGANSVPGAAAAQQHLGSPMARGSGGAAGAGGGGVLGALGLPRSASTAAAAAAAAAAAGCGSAGHVTASPHSTSGSLVYYKRKLYPAGRILHFFPSSALPGGAAAARTATASNTPSASASRTASLSASAASMLYPGSSGQLALSPTGASTPADDAMHASTTPADAAAAAAAAAAQPYVLLELPSAEAYARIKLCRSMVSDHLIPAYLLAVDSIILQLQQQQQ